MKRTKENTDYSWFKYICHQDPARSFHIKGKQMKLCARCTGLYSGLLIGILIGILIQIMYKGFDFTFEQLIIIVIIGVGPFAIDGLTQLFKWRESNNLIRLVTGLICGIILGIIIDWIIYDIIIGT
jgi:uncharacterized membrane protein